MGNLFWTVAVILLFTLGDRASTVLAQKSQSGVSQQSDLTPEKSEVSANATVVVTTQLDQGENGESSDEKNEEAEKRSGEISIEINGKKHSFSLGDETEQVNRTFKKVIRDGENSIAIIAGSVNGSGLDAESIQKMIKDASEGLPDSGELAEIFRDLPGNLSEEIEKNLDQLSEQMPDTEEMQKAMKSRLEAMGINDLGFGEMIVLPEIKMESFSLEGLDGLPEQIQKQLKDAMKMAGKPGASGKANGKATVRIFRMKDGKMIPVEEESDIEVRVESGQDGVAEGLKAVNQKLDAILRKLEKLQGEVDQLKVKK